MSDKCPACTKGVKAHDPQHIKSLRLGTLATQIC